ncbi:DNA translocase FtsK, partial [candidate division KSB1 bacterium]|nr:DNA translocase FtsK [candidate division KSB1 bacterium]NIR69378.1 DNA translocase FtsK [candidate division KSB1 bacterium]NIS24196.1 DNA translocase FtsK [candidate division KSB1 bacterium]NIT71111.1 DNA translocase FtsK [candidate division KSB1 bacterium]NIU24815.1 DNA translocase FtsK [candidate division KSB1 bacterium]
MSRSKNNLVSRQEEIIGILLITFGLLVLLSLLTYNPEEQPGNIEIGQIDNQLGIAGVYIAYFLNHYLIGRPSFVIPLIITFMGWSMFRGHSLVNSLRWSVYLLIFAVYTSIILALPEVISPGATELGYSLSGRVGRIVAQFMHRSLGVVGTILVLLAMIMITFIGATKISFSEFITEFMQRTASIISFVKSRSKRVRKRPKLKKEPSASVSKGFDSADKEVIEDVELGRGNNDKSAKKPQMEMELEIQEPGDAAGAALRREFLDPGNYKFPPMELLSTPQAREDEITKDELYANAQILEDRLLEFGVQGKVTDISPGPVITRYEVAPAPGVKISRIVSLADDLALAMRAKSVRIVAPIPGKGAVGIELPNRNREMVYLKEVIRSKQFQDSESPLALALGKTISGKPYVANLDEMPHLLIAGATGSGKSVCLNSIIASVLYKAHPTQVQMIMIDPKRLELSIFSNLRHHHLNYREDLNEEVVTSPANAISVLKSLERIME